jgi:DNA-nicking Smr family endonuclease
VSRKLSDSERALWQRVAATVEPMRRGQKAQPLADGPARPQGVRVKMPPPMVAVQPVEHPNRRKPERKPDERHGLDAGWDRKLARGMAEPDFTLDLHGASLDAAHARLDHGLALAAAQGARIVLLVTGRARLAEDHGVAGSHGRAERRGAIRAKFLDWLTAGPHAARIAAVRPAHPRHGGAGAVYLVLRRTR